MKYILIHIILMISLLLLLELLHHTAQNILSVYKSVRIFLKQIFYRSMITLYYFTTLLLEIKNNNNNILIDDCDESITIKELLYRRYQLLFQAIYSSNFLGKCLRICCFITQEIIN